MFYKIQQVKSECNIKMRNINVYAPLLFSGHYHMKLGNINELSRQNHNWNQQKFKPKQQKCIKQNY